MRKEKSGWHKQRLRWITAALDLRCYSVVCSFGDLQLASARGRAFFRAVPVPVVVAAEAVEVEALVAHPQVSSAPRTYFCIWLPERAHQRALLRPHSLHHSGLMPIQACNLQSRKKAGGVAAKKHCLLHQSLSHFAENAMNLGSTKRWAGYAQRHQELLR